MIDSLPNELFERCLSYLDTRDLCRVELVCKAFRKVSKVAHVWKHIALRKYGEEIFSEAESRPTYKSYKHMVADDMKLVATQALLMVDTPACAFWKYRRTDRFYVCLVLGIQYHRPTDEVRIYIEARGERDLRHPATSSIVVKYEKIIKARGFTGTSYGFGHYRGYVSFDACDFEYEGEKRFFYATPNPYYHSDYEKIKIGKFRRGKEAIHALSVACDQDRYNPPSHKRIYVTESWSPFVSKSGNDCATDEVVELERFRPFVDYPIWNRHNNMSNSINNRKWWVGRYNEIPSSWSDEYQLMNGDSDAYSAFMDRLVLIELARSGREVCVLE